ncbi:MAG: diguanylate cyclase [Vulcanimicrobiaceae bacterium]|jgi:diguanylate cyclase (GGDEF)-like protein
MRLRTLAWAFALVIVFVLPGAVRLRLGAAPSVPILKTADAFYDPSGKLRIEDAARAAFMTAAALPIFPEGFIPHVYWFRVTIPQDASGTSSVLAYSYKVTHIDVYREAGGLQHTGGGYDLADRDAALVPGLLELPQWAEGAPIYVRIATVIDPRSVTLEPLGAALTASLQRRVAFGFFVGFFVAIGAFNLWTFFALRDRPLLDYATVMFLEAAATVISFGVLWQVLPPLTFLARELIYDCAALGSAVALTVFTIGFLRLGTRDRRALSAVLVGTACALSVFATDFFPSTAIAWEWTLIATLLFYATLLYAGIRAARDGVPIGRIYAIGIACTILGYVVNMSSNALPRQDLFVYSYQVGEALQALILAIAVASSVQETRAENQRLIVESRKLTDLAAHDGLTGVLNRRSFDQALDAAATLAVATGKSLAVLILDIDHFKDYNDLLGHQEGDEALKLVAQACGACVRTGDIFARYGGEEFAAIVSDATLEDLQRIADRMVAALAELAIPRGDGSMLTISIGAANGTPLSPRDATEILEAADAELYSAKRHGRNRINLSLYEALT